jgi:hypothetical protein
VEFIKIFIPMLIVVIIVILGYNLLKLYVLDNIKINKWIVLGISIGVFLIPNIVWPGKVTGILQYIQTAIFLLFFLWFMDLIGLSGRGKRKVVNKNEIQKNNVIRAKAKPNRIKNNDIEVIQNNKTKTKTKKK